MTEQSFFIISNFMTEELELSGAELLVFALIHSFTQAAEGFSGSLEYLARRTGLSLRGTQNALKRLQDTELIEKDQRRKNGNHSIYYSTYAEELKILAKREEIKKLSMSDAVIRMSIDEEDARTPGQNSRYPVDNTIVDGAYFSEMIKTAEVLSFSDEYGSGMHEVHTNHAQNANNNKDIIKNITASAASAKGMPFGTPRDYRPKYAVRKYGENGLISMTDRQYQHLLTLVDSEVIGDYISRLEDIIMNKKKDFHKLNLRPYNLIRKWIREDFEIKP